MTSTANGQPLRSTRLSRVLRLLDAFDDKFLMTVVVVSLVSMALLISADTFYRYALNDSIEFVPKVVTKLLMVLVIFGGLNHATRHRAHVRVDFLLNRFPSFVGRLLTAIWDGLIALLLLGIAWKSYERGAAASNALIGTFDIPPRVSLFIVSAGCAFAALRLIVHLILQLLGAEPQGEEDAADSVV
jgi:TRAP-type C4-dicarboxylate transport system permease small subunit